MLVLHPLHIEIPEWLSLIVIVFFLGGGVLFSIYSDKKKARGTTQNDPKKHSNPLVRSED
jgi:hypothetical protein